MLKTVNVPAVVIAGEHDQITPVEVALAMAKEIPKGAIRDRGERGHMSPVENPEEVNMALSELLSIARY